MVEKAAHLLTPYDDRAVFNADAAMFHGVTNDTLARAAAFLGDPDKASLLRTQAPATYERLGAPWWRDRLASWRPRRGGLSVSRSARGTPASSTGGLWLVGPEPAVALRALRGFDYLWQLLRRPNQPVASLDLVAAGTGVATEYSWTSSPAPHASVDVLARPAPAKNVPGSPCRWLSALP